MQTKCVPRDVLVHSFLWLNSINMITLNIGEGTGVAVRLNDVAIELKKTAPNLKNLISWYTTELFELVGFQIRQQLCVE